MFIGKKIFASLSSHKGRGGSAKKKAATSERK
jgi:hypothetical protein